MKRKWFLIPLLCLLLALTACGGTDAGASPAPGVTGSAAPVSSQPAQTADPAETPASTETPAPSETPQPEVTYVDWGPDQIVEHIFFHPVIAYPQMAFDGDKMSSGIDDWMVTVGEYDKILQSIYDHGYILVNMNDVWSEVKNADGTSQMVRNTLKIPQGKKPLILSFDDVNYYDYMLQNGFTYKLIIGDDGELWSYGKDPQGKEVISQDLDAITILNKFVKEHPDFSLNGVKGCLCLTGYQGILGYRTNTDSNDTSAAHEANRQKEIAAVKPIIAKLKADGWYFGSHTWGHINLANKTLAKVESDTDKWFNEVGSLIGPTKLLFYPHGARPDGDDVNSTGPIFKYLQGRGFRVFSSVGSQSYSKIKTDICAVICDRLHPDGKTLRWGRSHYLQFYDAKDIIDLTVRPDLGYDFSK